MKTWQFLKKLMRFTRVSYFWTVFLQIPRRLLPLAPALIVQQIIDSLTHGMQLNANFWGLIGLFVGLVLARMTVLVMVQITERFPMFNVETLLRKNVLEHLLQQPGAQGLPTTIGNILSRLNDPRSLGLFLVMLAFTLGMTVETVVALLIMIHINLQLTLVAVLPLLVGNMVVNTFGKRIEHYRRINREAAGEVSGYLVEMFGMVQAIQVAGATPEVIKRFRSLNERRRQASLRENLFSNVVLGMFDTGISTIGVGLVLLLAGSALQAGHFTIGDFTLFVAYLSNLGRFSSELIGRFTGYRQVAISQQRLSEIMTNEKPAALVKAGPIYRHGPLPKVPALTSQTKDRLELLELRQLSYTYPGTGRGIAEINLRLQRGQFVVITGRIGAGKTTLLRTLLGLLSRNRGEILWNGEIVADPTTFFVPPRSAYTPQTPNLFSTTLRENIALGLQLDENQLARAVHMAVMERDIETLVDGLETTIGPKGIKLSGGQVQRTATARMFARSTELLVFDDLSSALDIETERLLWQRIFEPERHTCLVVSHRQAALQHADHILILKDGQIEAEGKLEQLLNTNEEMKRLWTSSP